jgi:fibronectin type 3 domain-containing protein
MSFGFRVRTSMVSALLGLSIAQLGGGAPISRGATPAPEPAVTKPATPSGVKTSVGNGRIGLTWNATSGATSYHVKRSTKSGGPYTTIASPTFSGYTNVRLSNGTTYYYVISAVDSAGESGNSAQIAAKPTNVAKPSAPGGLTAAAGNGQVGLTWAAPSGTTSYHLKRSTTSGGPYTQIAATTYAGYTDVGRTNGTNYYYVVSALNGAGESGNSAQASAKPGTSSGSAATSVTISPDPAASITGGTLTFNAKVQGAPNTAVTWSATLGTISQTGQYKAPAKAGTDTVKAASHWDSSKFDTASVKVTTAAPNPPPTSNPPPETSQSTGSGFPTSFFGMTVNQTTASHYPTAQIGAIRLWDTNTAWGDIEYARHSYKWNELDTWLREAHSHGQQAMYTFGRVPHWASMRPSEACPYDTSSGGCAAPPSDVSSGDATFKAFVTALVKHSLSSPELYIAYYEMWNEPDLKRNWSGTPAQLVQMAKDAYSVIHSLDPKAKLVGPSASTANQYGVHFLPDYYNAGGASAQDAVGMHAYLYNGSNFASNPSGITTTITQLKKLMSAHSISSKPIWFTEGSWGGDTSTNFSDAQKAAYLAQEHMLMFSTDSVARFFWYSWDSGLGTLWTPSGGPTQAGRAYTLLQDWLIGSTHSSSPCHEGSDGTWTCSLTLETGYPAEIIWNAGASKTITVDGTFVTYRTLSNNTVHSISNHRVSIGPLPIMVVKGQTVN